MFRDSNDHESLSHESIDRIGGFLNLGSVSLDFLVFQSKEIIFFLSFFFFFLW